MRVSDSWKNLPVIGWYLLFEYGHMRHYSGYAEHVTVWLGCLNYGFSAEVLEVPLWYVFQ